MRPKPLCLLSIRAVPSTSVRLPSLRALPSKPLRVLALAFAALVLAGVPMAQAKRKKKVTVTAALQGLERDGQITQSTYLQDQRAFAAAKRTLGNLSGTRRQELGAVLANIEAMAGAGELAASRLPVAFTTVERNRQFWSTQPLPGADQRVAFAGSRLVWEYYPGQGVEIQWLGTFGEANGYYLSHQTTALAEVLDEAIALATHRAGGIAWEYMFQFDGGPPPWTSGLSQGTALQALARAYSRTDDAEYLDAAKEALGIFRAPPPEGVLERTSAGSHYLEYTYARGEHILNGFIQSLVGLYEYTKLTGDPEGQALFEAGDAEARAETPHYDTGSWSLYDQHVESDLSYHELLAEFLEHLCQRTSTGEPLATTHSSIAGDQVYCTTAEHLRQYVKEPPQIALLTQKAHTRQRAGVQVQLSKVSTVSISISLGGHTVWTNAATIEGGTPRLLWVTPSKPGAYAVTIKARDLAGNEASTSGTIVLSKAPRAKHAHVAAVGPTTAITPPARPQPQL